MRLHSQLRMLHCGLASLVQSAVHGFHRSRQANAAERRERNFGPLGGGWDHSLIPLL